MRNEIGQREANEMPALVKCECGDFREGNERVGDDGDGVRAAVPEDPVTVETESKMHLGRFDFRRENGEVVRDGVYRQRVA